MVRIRGGVVTRRRHKKILKMAKGYYQGHSRNFRAAKETVIHALDHRREELRKKKRRFRRLWIARINAAVRELGMSYSKFMNALNKANVKLNRKMLAGLAVSKPEVFKKVVEAVK